MPLIRMHNPLKEQSKKVLKLGFIKGAETKFLIRIPKLSIVFKMLRNLNNSKVIYTVWDTDSLYNFSDYTKKEYLLSWF